MNDAFVGVWFNIRLCYHKLITSHMMRPQPFFIVVTLVVVVVGGYILVIHLSHMLTLCAEILIWDCVYTLTLILYAVEKSFS